MQRHKATPELFIEKTTISKLLALLITLKTVQNQQFVWNRKGPTLNEPSSTSVQSPSRPLSSPLTISADIAEDGDLFQMSATLDGKLLSFNTFFNSASFHKNIINYHGQLSYAKLMLKWLIELATQNQNGAVFPKTVAPSCLWPAIPLWLECCLHWEAVQRDQGVCIQASASGNVVKSQVISILVSYIMYRLQDIRIYHCVWYVYICTYFYLD